MPYLFDTDPIRFTMTANKKRVPVGEEIEISLTAHFFTISRALLYKSPEASTFRIKVLMPEGFVQTGGDYVDYIGTRLSSANPIITYTLKGYFTRVDTDNQFRLLRGPHDAGVQSLFVEKGQLTFQVVREERQAAARTTSTYSSGNGGGTIPNASASLVASNNATLSVNCGASSLNVSGSLSTSNNNQISMLIFKDNAIVNMINDMVGPSFNQTIGLSGPGNYYAKVREVNNDANEVNSAGASVNCSSNPTPSTTPPPPSGGNSNNPGSGSGTSTPATTCSVSNPRGCVDVVTAGVLSGWAFDESNFGNTLLIDIYANGVKVATVPANEDRPDLVGAFGNNPAARYHGFSAEWDYFGQGTQSYNISIQICGTSTPLRTQQVTFQNASNPNARKGPIDGGTLDVEVTVRAKRTSDDGSTKTGNGPGSGSGSGSSAGGSDTNNDSNDAQFLEKYKLLGPKKPVNISQKLDCFGDVPTDPRYKYSITMYVDQPVNGTRTIAQFDTPDRRPGHVYLGFESYDSQTGAVKRLVAGYYVQSETTAAFTLSTPGAWGDDGSTPYDVSLKVDLSASAFKNVIYNVKNLGTPMYNVRTNNCTTFAYNIMEIYVPLPPGTGNIGPIGLGYTPADLGQDLQERQSQYGDKLKVADNSSSPSSTNCN